MRALRSWRQKQFISLDGYLQETSLGVTSCSVRMWHIHWTNGFYIVLWPHVAKKERPGINGWKYHWPLLPSLPLIHLGYLWLLLCNFRLCRIRSHCPGEDASVPGDGSWGINFSLPILRSENSETCSTVSQGSPKDLSPSSSFIHLWFTFLPLLFHFLHFFICPSWDYFLNKLPRCWLRLCFCGNPNKDKGFRDVMFHNIVYW